MNGKTNIPEKYKRFRCEDYFALDKYRAEGEFDAIENVLVIFPEKDISIDKEKGHLVIGSSGTDGVVFCYREGMDGIWAYYPVDDEYARVVSDVGALVRGWSDGKIKV